LQVKDAPVEVSWPGVDSAALYTILFTDPDAPTQKQQNWGEVIHWLFVNVHGNDLKTGEAIQPYVGSGPPEGTGLHRYVLSVYKQPGKLPVDELKKQYAESRLRFSTRKFLAKYGLGKPIAGNFYHAQIDDYVRGQRSADLIAALNREHVVPEVVNSAPNILSLEVIYNSGVFLYNHGSEFTPTELKDKPYVVGWKTEPNALYTLILTDPDVPSRTDRKQGEFLHWLVVNIPGTDLAKGESYADYVGSGPPKGSGLHRYVYLVYKQPGHLKLDRPKADAHTAEGRFAFKAQEFAKSNRLGTPHAGNFYLAQYDDYVPNIHAQLGVKP